MYICFILIFLKCEGGPSVTLLEAAASEDEGSKSTLKHSRAGVDTKRTGTKDCEGSLRKKRLDIKRGVKKK